MFGLDIVTMQSQKEAPLDLQCKDKFLLQSVKVNDGVTPKDITPEMVKILCIATDSYEFVRFMFNFIIMEVGFLSSTRRLDMWLRSAN